jgi:hypothetical protein
MAPPSEPRSSLPELFLVQYVGDRVTLRLALATLLPLDQDGVDVVA